VRGEPGAIVSAADPSLSPSLPSALGPTASRGRLRRAQELAGQGQEAQGEKEEGEEREGEEGGSSLTGPGEAH